MTAQCPPQMLPATLGRLAEGQSHGLRQRLTNLLEGRLLRNIFALYLGKFVNQLLPLAVIPFLSRVLGPSEWGRLAMAQALAVWGIFVVQYGFQMSATRAVAQNRYRPEQLSAILTGVLGAQALLTTAFVILALGLHFSVPAYRDMSLLLGCAVGYAILQALTPTWYFTGQERITLVAGIDAAVKLSTLVAIFMLVGGPADGWKVMAIYGTAAGISAAVAFTLLLREVKLARFSLRRAIQTLSGSASLGLLSVISTAMNAGTPVLLGVLLAPQQVAFFVAAEKLCRPLAYLLDPINTALMPRLSHLMRSAPGRARQLAGISLLVVIAIATLLAIGIIAAAPSLVPLIFGQGYEAAIPVVRILALMIPLEVARIAIATQWLVPHGHDRWLITCVMIGAVFYVGLALLVIPDYGIGGTAWVAVAHQGLVVTGLALALWRCLPLVRRRPAEAVGT